MSAFYPAYRMTVYARGLNGIESTALIPSGSTHTDPFQVASISGVSGFQPYLGIPKGTKSYTTLPTSKLVAGRITATILDNRLTPGGSNYLRWVTGFLADEHKRLQLFGRKVYLEESLDAGSTWSAFFVGRITNIGLSSGLEYSIEITDSFQDIGRTIFDRIPHLSYIVPEKLIPAGLGTQVLSIPLLYPNASLVAQVTGIDTTRKGAYFLVQNKNIGSYYFPPARLTPEFTNSVTPLTYIPLHIGVFNGGIPEFPVTNPNIHTRVQFYSTADSSYIGEMILYEYIGDNDTYDKPVIKSFLVFEDAETVGHMTVASLYGGQQMYFTMTSPKRPFYLNNVHPLDVVTDICSGSYSPYANLSGSNITIGLDATSISNLKANTSRILPGTFRITSPMTIQKFIEEYVCQPYSLGYCTVPVANSGNPQSQLRFFDLALPSSSIGLPTIGQDDIVADAVPQWVAVPPIKSFTYNYYSDFLDPMTLIHPNDRYPKTISVRNVVENLDIPDMYLPANSFTVDANGVRGGIAVTGSDSTFGPQYDKKIEPYAKTLSSVIVNRWINTGNATLSLKCRRTTTITGMNIGDWVFVTLDKAPNQALNQRGGTRIMQVTKKDEQGLTVNVMLTDGAINTVAPSPSVGTLTAISSSASISVALPLTTTFNGGVSYQILAGSLGEGTPNATDSRWRTVGTYQINNTTYTAYSPNIYAGTTVYGRARTEYLLSGSVLPSTWVTSNNVTIPYLNPPSGLSVSSITTSSAALSWTDADSTSLVEIMLASPSTDPLSTVIILDPNSVHYTLQHLDQDSSTSHQVGLRHRDSSNNVSTIVSASFIATGSSATTLPTPFVEIFIGT